MKKIIFFIIISGLAGLMIYNTYVKALTIAYPIDGGTGTYIVPATGEILVGQPDGTYLPQATSTLGISSTPAGSHGQIQFNNNGAFGATSSLMWDTTKNQLQLGQSDTTFTEQFPLVITGDLNDYIALAIKNINSGDTATTDLSISADNDGLGLIGHYIDMGITSSGYLAGATGNIETVSISATGTGYTVGDILTLIGGDENGTVEVTEVDGSGGLVSIDLYYNGTSYTVASGLETTGGTGASSTINVLTVIDNSLFGANDGYLYNSGGDLLIGTDQSVVGTAIKFFNGGSGTLNEKMRITSDGKVGIGTTSPSAKLSIKGTGLTTGKAFAVSNSANSEKFTVLDNGNVGMSAGSQLTYNGAILAQASTTKNNWFFGNSGNLTFSSANNNAAIGDSSMYRITTGYQNMGMGVSALRLIQTGYDNIGIGFEAGRGIDSGSRNVAIGTQALRNGDTTYNTAIGYKAGLNSNGTGNSYIGYQSGQTNDKGTLNTFIGYNTDVAAAASTTLTNSTAIGNGAIVTASNQMVFGNTSVTQTLLNGNVGIGTTTPLFKLTVSGGIYADYLTMSSTTATSQIFGKLLIGTIASPGLSALQITDNSGNATGMDIRGNRGVGNVASGFMKFYNTANYIANISSYTSTSGSGGQLVFSTANSAGTLSEQMRINDNGNVGIGSTSPTAKLSVTGSGLTTGKAFSITDSANTEKFTVLDNGNVGVGTTTPSDKLEVVGTSTFQEIKYVGKFAEIYLNDASTTQSIPTGATYTKFTGWTANGESSILTADATNDQIIITRAGKYKVNAVIYATTGTLNTNFKSSIFVGGVEHSDAHGDVNFSALATKYSFPLSAIITATSTSVVDLRVRHDQGGSVDLTATYGNMNVEYLGE